jgi:hypothetical protein
VLQSDLGRTLTVNLTGVTNDTAGTITLPPVAECRNKSLTLRITGGNADGRASLTIGNTAATIIGSISYGGIDGFNVTRLTATASFITNNFPTDCYGMISLNCDGTNWFLDGSIKSVAIISPAAGGYQVLASDLGRVIYFSMNGAGAASTITLPTVASGVGRSVVIRAKVTTAHALTIASAAADILGTIVTSTEGSPDVITTTHGASAATSIASAALDATSSFEATCRSNGTNWFVTGVASRGA